MKVKRYTQFGIALCALFLTLLSIKAVKTENENLNGKEQQEHESAAGYIAWRNQILSNQITGTVDPVEIARINRDIDTRNAALNKTNAGMDWTELGPDNVGGRTRSILIDRVNSNIVFAGSVSGGIWKSTTAGASWTRVNDNMLNLNISSLTQTTDGSIFVGTGETSFANQNGSTTFGSPGFDGNGVYKSTDGGVTFTLLPSTDATLPGKSIWSNTNDIKADPIIANKIYAGNTNGLYISTDGGTTWTKASTTPAAGGNCIDIDVSKDGSVVATVIGTNIYISVDGGASFNRLTPSLSIWGGTPGRISLAIANSNSNYIYAMAANAATNRTLSAVQSTDKGQTWTRIITGSPPYVDIVGSAVQGQGNWNNVTAVDPDDAEHAYFGGIDLWDWTPSIGIHPISVWSNPITSTKYVHADNHAIVWDTKTTPATMYIGNDGGVFKSLDKGKNFFASNHGYKVTQFYAVGAAYVNDDIRSTWVVAGGSQDNGTWIIDGLGNTSQSGVFAKGGDGFYAALSQKIPGYAILSTYDSDLSSYLKFKSRDDDFNQKYDQTFFNTRIASFCKDSGIFNTPFTLWETSTNDSISLFLFAANGAAWIAKDIYQDLSKVPTWYRVINFNGQGTCVDISQDGNTALIGTSAGAVYKVDNIRSNGIFDSASATLYNADVSQVFSAPGRYVNGVSFCKTDKNKVVVTLGNYNNNDFVYYCTNLISATPTFASIQGNLPKIPVYDAELLWDDPTILILATERGMYVSKNFSTGSPAYTYENNGMANVPVFQLNQYKFNNWKGSRFYIATHGRGFFQSTTYASTGITASDEKLNSLSIYPNPAKTTTTLSFNAKHSAKATIAIYNMAGLLIRSEEINTTSGKNNYGFYVNDMPNGNYIVMVNQDGIKEARKLIVVR
jgi:photosystem II stability/assembly factor-like uncharacterized protein